MVRAVMDKKPCPFCTYADPIIHGDADLFWIECMNPECCAEGPMRDTEEEAISAWNRAIRLEVAPGAACNHIEWCFICNPTLEERT
jgi:hypothetical protein